MSILKKIKRRNFTQPQAEEVYKKQNGCCGKCQKPLQLYQLHKHHQNGDETDNRIENLRLLCSPCHHSEPFMLDDKRRNNTHRITTYLSNDSYNNFITYLNSNYSSTDAYGARSEVVNNAILSYCANPSITIDHPSISIPHIDEESVRRIIEEHKETLDALAEYDKRPIGNVLEEMKKDV